MTIRTYLDHLPEQKQHHITTIRDVILDDVEAFVKSTNGKKTHYRIVHIILFGSYAKGTYVDDPANCYISDYDILIVLNESDMVDETVLWRRIEDKAERRVKSPVNFIIHGATEVDKWLKEGQYFFSDIQREGIYLYSYNPSGKGLPEPKHLSNQERKPIAEKHFKQWFESANSFLRQFGYAMSDNDFKMAAFLLHQATERLYATLLLTISNYRPKTHNLKRLRSMTIQLDDSITTTFPQNTRFSRRCFDLLKRAYIDARYSEHYKITDEELSWLGDQVKLLKRDVESISTTHIETLTK
jgi:uncharacterized protein